MSLIVNNDHNNRYLYFYIYGKHVSRAFLLDDQRWKVLRVYAANHGTTVQALLEGYIDRLIAGEVDEYSRVSDKVEKINQEIEEFKKRIIDIVLER